MMVYSNPTYFISVKVCRKTGYKWAAMTVFYGSLRSFQAGFKNITEIDTEFTNLRKVTDENTESLRQFTIEANNIGNAIGKTTQEVVSSVAEFARLGYEFDQARTLAQQALVYSQVGDIDVVTASTNLISSIKGFGMAVDEEGRNAQRAVDIFNEIGNNYAISTAGVGEALTRSASSMHEAGNSIEQSVALLTAANASMQDPERVGNFFAA